MKIHAFSVTTGQNSQPLEDVFTLIESTPLVDRSRSLSGSELQMEDLIRHPDGFWQFELVKLNFGVGPGRGRIGGATQGFHLEKEEAFAESTACLYCPESQNLLVEYKHAGARSGAIEEYLSAFNESASNVYGLDLRLDPDAKRRLDKKTVFKSIHLRVAPTRLKDIDRQSGYSLGLALDQSDSFGGDLINLEISTQPYSASSLHLPKVTELGKWIRRVIRRGDDAILNANFTGRAEEDGKNETINLIDEKLEAAYTGYKLDGTRRYRLSDRYNALERTYRAWRNKL